MENIAEAILPSGHLMLRYADMLLDGITPEKFARKPEGVEMNSPAFCFGHLALYPEHMLVGLGCDDLIEELPSYEELFAPGRECRDDPDATIYPAMDEIVARFRARHSVALDAIKDASDDLLMRENPREKMREYMPTTGSAITFYLGGHAMMHLGQVSAWRRMMGLASVM